MFFDFSAGSKKTAPSFRWFWLNDRNPLSGHAKRRRIYDPNKPMRELHHRLIRYLRGLHVSKLSSTGARPGSSPLKNVLSHRHRPSSGNTAFPRFFFLVDISGAYASVIPEKLVGAIVSHDIRLKGRDNDVRRFLTDYCLSAEEGGLIVGAPASPDLFNFYCEALMDSELRKLCTHYGLTYTRYLDDLTFSSDQPIGKKKRRALCALIAAAGFKLNSRKAQVLDLAKGPITVNGVGITWEGRYFLPRHALRELRGLLHLALVNRPINLSVVHGKMGVFKALTDPRYLNKTERVILGMYSELKRLNSRPKTGL